MYTPRIICRIFSFGIMKNINLLLSGAAGLSGSMIARALARHGQPVKALIHRNTPETLPGITVTTADMLIRESLLPVLEGIDRAILISTANEHMVEAQCNFIDACKTAGVRHVIKFSGEEAQQDFDPQRFRFTREHEQIEDYLENSGLAWTHLRPSQFMQVYLRELPVIRQTGVLRLPLEQITMSPVDLYDVAEVMAQLLINGGYEGKSLRMTGPESLTMAQVAVQISLMINQPVYYEAVNWAEREKQLAAAGLPGYFIEALAEQTAERVRNPQAIIDLSTHQLFGIEPTTFKQFARRQASLS